MSVGVLRLVLSVPAEACVHGGGVADSTWTAVESPPGAEAALVVLVAGALVGGS